MRFVERKGCPKCARMVAFKTDGEPYKHICQGEPLNLRCDGCGKAFIPRDGKMPEHDCAPACICPPSYAANDHHETPCPLNTDTKENANVNDRRRQHGPLSPLQATILDRLMAGERQQTLAKELGFSESYISGETSLSTAKLRARTTAHACTLYATAKAYLEAADMLDQSSRAHPQEDGVAEDHVNHVLMALAETLRERAAALLPK